MANKPKTGLDYFPMDVDVFSDIKIRKLIKYQSGKAITVYAYLLCNIYNEGYYIKWDDELPFIISEATGFEEAYIREVIKSCFAVNIFSKSLFDSHQVLTSKGIQIRYEQICKQAKRKLNVSEFNLINSEELPKNSEELSISSDELPQSKGKESIEKETKESNDSSGKTKVLPTEDEIALKNLKAEYNALPKTKQNIVAFVKRKPLFIEPYVDLWNIYAEERKKPKVQEITSKRAAHFNARIKEKGFDFIEILGISSKSKILLEGTWFTFDWFMKSKDNYVKIIEGNYNQTTEGQSNERPTNEAEAILERKLAGKV